MFRKRILVAILVITLLGVILVVNIPQTRGVQFFLSGWDYPDEYGQGIEVLWLQTNETGSWVTFPDTGRGHLWFLSDDDTSIALNYSSNMALRVEVDANINHTLFSFGPDKSENASARAIMRVGLTLSNRSGVIFSLDNMTWGGNCYDDSATVWAIDYVDIVDVILQPATIYFLRFTYEIFI